MSGVSVRNLEKIQDKWLLFQRFVTSFVDLSGILTACDCRRCWEPRCRTRSKTNMPHTFATSWRVYRPHVARPFFGSQISFSFSFFVFISWPSPAGSRTWNHWDWCCSCCIQSHAQTLWSRFVCIIYQALSLSPSWLRNKGNVWRTLHRQIKLPYGRFSVLFSRQNKWWWFNKC